MAKIIQNKYPLDQQDRKAIGFSLPMNGDAVFKPTYQTRDQIKANLVNYLLTNVNERVFRPSFGGDLRNLIFENIVEDTIEELKERIQNDISVYFPQIVIKNIEFKNQEDQNTINFILTYEVVLFGIEDSVNILIQ